MKHDLVQLLNFVALRSLWSFASPVLSSVSELGSELTGLCSGNGPWSFKTVT